jgi:hypothetical protein
MPQRRFRLGRFSVACWRPRMGVGHDFRKSQRQFSAAEAVVFLAETEFITGQVIAVDGGRLLS